jgi:hypothetical protein
MQKCSDLLICLGALLSFSLSCCESPLARTQIFNINLFGGQNSYKWPMATATNTMTVIAVSKKQTWDAEGFLLNDFSLV